MFKSIYLSTLFSSITLGKGLTFPLEVVKYSVDCFEHIYKGHDWVTYNQRKKKEGLQNYFLSLVFSLASRPLTYT